MKTYAYLDDIILGDESKEEHNQNLKSFLNALKDANLTFNEAKLTISISEINALGYCIFHGVISDLSLSCLCPVLKQN